MQYGRTGFDPWVGKIPWRRAWQSTPVFLPGESPWTEEPGRLQSMRSQRVGHDLTERLSTHTHTHTESERVRNEERLCPSVLYRLICSSAVARAASAVTLWSRSSSSSFLNSFISCLVLESCFWASEKLHDKRKTTASLDAGQSCRYRDLKSS